MTQIFGHRGSAGTHPENTMISFQEVAKVGADGVELDVQRTKDGHLVCIHDETVNRTTNGKGWVKDLLLKEIEELDASYKFSDTYGFCKIPTLHEVFRWAQTNQLLINVELKNSLVIYKGLEEDTIALIQEFDLEQRIILSSFNHDSMAKCHKLNPKIQIALLFMERLYQPSTYAKQLGALAVHPYRRVVSKEMVEKSHKDGIAVRPFTVNSSKMLKEMFSYHCDGVITDFPKRALGLVRTEKRT